MRRNFSYSTIVIMLVSVGVGRPGRALGLLYCGLPRSLLPLNQTTSHSNLPFLWFWSSSVKVMNYYQEKSKVSLTYGADFHVGFNLRCDALRLHKQSNNRL